MHEFQSTLPRRERRTNGSRKNREQPISIHAPAKGATLSRAYKCCNSLISIHAPAKGATDKGVSQIDTPGDFNPRSREGSDISLVASTHTAHNFNPRSREGSDVGNFEDFKRSFDFNPRSREGSDISQHLRQGDFK